MSPPVSSATASPPRHPDLSEPTKAHGAGGPKPPAPKAAPAPPNPLTAHAHSVDRPKDSAGAAMVRRQQGQEAPATSSGATGPGPAPAPWVRTTNLAPSVAAPAPAPKTEDDASLAKIPREQMKKEVEDAQAAVQGAMTPEARAAAEQRLATTKARADRWARAAITQGALPYAGTGAHNQPDRYLEILAGPGDDPKTREEMLKQSSCALFARGALRKAGVEDGRLERTYVRGKAVSDVEGIAMARGAWVDTTSKGGAKGKLPQKGDVIVIDDSPRKYDPKTGDPIYHEHVIVVVGEPRQDPSNPKHYLVDTVEGGQGAGGRESHAFGVPEPGASKALPPRVIERRDDGTLWMGKRKVMGWADGGKVANPTRAHTGGEKTSEPAAAKPSAPKPSAAKPARKVHR